MKRWFFLILTFTFGAISIFAESENRSLSGRILDRKTGRPIPDATVMVAGTALGTTSRDGGFYCLERLPADSFDVEARVIGYETVTRRCASGSSADFKLESKAVELDPVLVTATRSDHLSSQVSAAHEVLTCERIGRSGATAGEVLESASSVFFKDYDGFAGPLIPSIRGSNPEQVLVFLDGQRLNGPQGGGVDLNTIPSDMLDRVEIVRGGYSSLYGSDAVGGVIRLVSKETAPEGFACRLRSTAGSFGLWRHAISASHRTGALSLWLDAGRIRSDGDFRFRLADNSKAERKNNDFSGDHVMIKARADWGRRTLTASFQSMSDRRGVGGSIDYPSLLARRDEDNRLGSVRFEDQTTNRLRIEYQASFQEAENRYRDPGAWVPENDKHTTRVWTFETQAEWRPWERLSLTGGGELRKEDLVSTEFSARSRDIKSLFLETEWECPVSWIGIDGRMKWTPSIRWDRYEGWAPETCPKLGAWFETGSTLKMTLRGNVGRSFRAPSFNDLYWPEDAYTKGNPALTPEYGVSRDAGFAVSWAKSFPIYWETTRFRNDFDDLIIWEAGPDWKWSPRNVGKARIDGWEHALSIRLGENSLGARFTWMDAVDLTPGSPDRNRQLIYRPRTQWSLNGQMKTGPVALGADYRIVDRRYTTSDNSKTLPKYSILNVHLSSSVGLAGILIEIRLEVLNAFDKSIWTYEGYPMPGRQFRFGLSFGG